MPLQYLSLKKLLSSNASSHPDDILNTKDALTQIGFYTPDPEIGITDFTDNALFDGIRDFQKEHKLPENGEMRPGDQTHETLNKQLEKKSAERSGIKEESLVSPPEPTIPGTNIPDHGISEEEWWEWHRKAGIEYWENRKNQAIPLKEMKSPNKNMDLNMRMPYGEEYDHYVERWKNRFKDL